MPKYVQAKGTDGYSYTLHYSADSGDANLMVGFFLEGPDDIIKYVKIWDFGDNTLEKDHSIVANHFYDSRTPSPCIMTMTIADLDPSKPPIVQFSIQIKITKHEGKYISNFYQTEGVAIDNSAVGFAIAETRIENPPLIWDYDSKGGTDEQEDSGISQINPNHRYKKWQYDPPYQGTVKLFEAGKPLDPSKPLDQWNFSAMILPSLIKYVGWIDFFSDRGNKTAKVKIGSPVSFTVQVSGGIPFDDASYKWDVQAKSLDVITPPVISYSGPSAYCTFSKSATYQIRCMISQTSSTSTEPFLIVSTYVYAENEV